MPAYGLGTHLRDGERRAALVVDDEVHDLVEALGAESDGQGSSVAELLHGWERAEPALTKIADTLAGESGKGGPLAAPYRPTRIFAAASNYVEHAEEMGTALLAKKDSHPYMFTKVSSTVVGPEEAVVLPRESKKVDWEVELGVVIGRGGRRIDVDRALEHVMGYTVVNDVSARDLTRRDDYPFKFDWFQGKNFDTFLPMGPWITPATFVPDPLALRLRLEVNDETMQDATTAEMIFDVREQIAYLSTLVTLEPGDLIATGTPTGVGMGRGVFLKPGDVMTASIEGLGSLRSPVVAEPGREA